jgi:hypothetical protein
LNLQRQIIHDCHDSLFYGHMGRDKTTELVKRLFWWPRMDIHIAQYVENCHMCQTAKSAPTVRQGLLQPLAIPERPWWGISTDFITGLPTSAAGYDAILTVVDRLTKMVHLIPTNTTVDAHGFAQLFKDHVIAKHGIPGDIVSDRDPRFTGHFWKEVSKLLDINLSFSTAWHPQSDGSTERVNRMVEQVLRTHTQQRQETWQENLSMVEFAINNAAHTSVKYTPFYLNYGQHPVTPIMHDMMRHGNVPTALKFTTDMQKVVQEAKANLSAARDRMKSYADNNRVERQFALGDKVLLDTKNLKPVYGTKKLFPKWVGPFVVVKQVNDAAYQIKLPSNMRIHDVFHVSLLRPYKTDGRVQPPPTPVEVEGELEYEVESILLHRESKPGKIEYYVKWVGYGPEHCTWEPERNMKNSPEMLDVYWKQRYVSVASKQKVNQITKPLYESSMGIGMKRQRETSSQKGRHTKTRTK